jgi:Rrf2 family protein
MACCWWTQAEGRERRPACPALRSGRRTPTNGRGGFGLNRRLFDDDPALLYIETSLIPTSLKDPNVKLTRAATYALLACRHLSKQADPTRLVPSHLIAAEHAIPERFLLKVLLPLVAAGVLRSVKGPHGGYRFARPPGKVSMLEVIEAVNGPIRSGVPEDMKHPDLAGVSEVCAAAAKAVRDRLDKPRSPPFDPATTWPRSGCAPIRIYLM